MRRSWVKGLKQASGKTQQGAGSREAVWKPPEQESDVDLPIVPALLLLTGKGEENFLQQPG